MVERQSSNAVERGRERKREEERGREGGRGGGVGKEARVERMCEMLLPLNPHSTVPIIAPSFAFSLLQQ